nr:type IV pilus twitching motility protein PilT [Tindallia magadiensis]
MNINEILLQAAERKASDVHIGVGHVPMIRINGELQPLNNRKTSAQDTISYVQILLSGVQSKILSEKGQVDFAYQTPNGYSYRMNVFRYRDYYGFACRLVHHQIPTIAQLELPQQIEKIAKMQSGLVIVAGPTGCGKTTTIASIVDVINTTRRLHILTIEDPIEYIYQDKMSMITQREIGRDCNNFYEALHAGLRQDPDVIVVGELRDLETMQTAITAAETGHLVLVTLHTRNAQQTIERIIDVFPSGQQQQIRFQMASSLNAVISQRLIPRMDEVTRIPAVEILFVTPAIRTLIREGKAHQINSFIQTGRRNGMQTIDDHLSYLFKKGSISLETLKQYTTDEDYVFSKSGTMSME